MNAATLFGLCGAALVGVGLYGLVTNPEPLRKILAFNLLGSGVFLVFGVVARRAAAAGLGGDPVPQAMVITAIVVAFAATAMAIALVLRLLQETGRSTLSADNPGGTVRTEATPDAGRKRLARRDNDRWRVPGSGDRIAGRGRSVVVRPRRAVR